MNIDSKVLICRSDNPLVNKLDGEVIMLDPQKGVYYNLNRVGSFIWDMLEKPATLDDICREILSEFEVEEEICRKDAVEYITRMNEYGLIRFSEE
ncbi:MAG: PqqD family protein [Victivallaceae bacterium]|nr:PqqD family protein [Victivallaceae bacterium]